MPDHGTFEQYYLEKLKLVERVSEGVPVILNRDDPHVYEARQVTPGDVITISIDHRDVTITADSLKMAGGIPSFNFSALMNYGLSKATGEHILYLNNDTEIIHADWMRAGCLRSSAH